MRQNLQQASGADSGTLTLNFLHVLPPPRILGFCCGQGVFCPWSSLLFTEFVLQQTSHLSFLLPSPSHPILTPLQSSICVMPFGSHTIKEPLDLWSLSEELFCLKINKISPNLSFAEIPSEGALLAETKTLIPQPVCCLWQELTDRVFHVTHAFERVSGGPLPRDAVAIGMEKYFVRFGGFLFLSPTGDAQHLHVGIADSQQEHRDFFFSMLLNALEFLVLFNINAWHLTILYSMLFKL